MDRGFEDAKKRVNKREKKTGFGFKRNKRISRKKVEKLIRSGDLKVDMKNKNITI